MSSADTQFKPVHGRAGKRDRTYESWRSMNRRCAFPGHKSYACYGGRGISVCERWAKDFNAFLADMGDAPEGKTLDRIDNEGNYEPGNCRWATPIEQARNRRKTIRVAAFGKTRVMVDVCEEWGIRADTFMWRLKRGMSVESALSFPVSKANTYMFSPQRFVRAKP